MTIYYTYMNSPAGRLLLAAGENGLKSISFPIYGNPRKPGDGWILKEEPFGEAISQLRAYFAGTLRKFDLRLDLEGTPFQLAVWEELRSVPYGTTVSYGSIARRIGKPKAVRAVGGANRRNPIPIIVPCHRVIGRNGNLTGFAAGLNVKRMLLELEKCATGVARNPTGQGYCP